MTKKTIFETASNKRKRIEFKVQMARLQLDARAIAEDLDMSVSYAHAILNGRADLSKLNPKKLKAICTFLGVNHQATLIDLGLLDGPAR